MTTRRPTARVCATTSTLRILQTRMPPSAEVLEQRLRGRSRDHEADIQRRLLIAKREVASFTEYDFIVVNDHVDAAVERLQHVVLAERSRLNRMGGAAESIVRTFHD